MMVVRRTRNPLTACRVALRDGLLRTSPGVAIDSKGYVPTAGDNLVDGVRLADVAADLAQGSGNELAGKFRAAHSSSALAVNVFAPFKARPQALNLPGGSGFTRVDFERKCPAGLRGRTPPNLDLVAEGPDGVVAIESKCLEYLSPHTARFSPAYAKEITDWRRDTGWFREMERLVDEPRTYRWLDATQLIKHAFGLGHTFPDKPVTLLYLFWEPANPNVHPVFAEHRTEITHFAKTVADVGPRFEAMSYPELWKFWSRKPNATWIRLHLDHVKARYSGDLS